MDDLYDILISVFGDVSAMMLALLVFLAAAVLAFGLMATVHARGLVKRRAGGINKNSGDNHPNNENALRQSSLKAIQRLLDYTTKHYSAGEGGGAVKVLRRRMIQAGIFDARAVAFFFVARIALAVVLAFCVFVSIPLVLDQSSSVFWLSVIVGAIVGYIAPSMYLAGRTATRPTEHRL